jgi:hypothetical protein
MQGIMKYRIVPAALFAVVVALSAVSDGKAEAATLTVTYNGVVELITDPGSVTGLNPGDTVVGTVVIDPAVDSFTETTASFVIYTTTIHTFAEAGSFTFGKPGDSPFEVTGASGCVSSSSDNFLNFPELHVTMANGGDVIELGASSSFSSTSALASLAQLPTDAGDFTAFLGGIFPIALGVINYQGAMVHFRIGAALPTTTPIPAALPLFASALGGLGVAGWKRRKSAASA